MLKLDDRAAPGALVDAMLPDGARGGVASGDDAPDNRFGVFVGGLSMIIPGGVSFYLQYLTAAGHDYITRHDVSMGGKMEF